MDTDKKKLRKYNDKLSKKWSIEATSRDAELLIAIAVEATDGKAEVYALWDNYRGNTSLLDYMKQVVAMLENNKDTNFSINKKDESAN